MWHTFTSWPLAKSLDSGQFWSCSSLSVELIGTWFFCDTPWIAFFKTPFILFLDAVAAWGRCRWLAAPRNIFATLWPAGVSLSPEELDREGLKLNLFNFILGFGVTGTLVHVILVDMVLCCTLEQDRVWDVPEGSVHVLCILPGLGMVEFTVGLLTLLDRDFAVRTGGGGFGGFILCLWGLSRSPWSVRESMTIVTCDKLPEGCMLAEAHSDCVVESNKYIQIKSSNTYLPILPGLCTASYF